MATAVEVGRLVAKGTGEVKPVEVVANRVVHLGVVSSVAHSEVFAVGVT